MLNSLTRIVLGCATVVGLAAYARRTRDVDAIEPQLRNVLTRLRSPSIGPVLTRVGRLAPATRCVSGVQLRHEQIRSADGTIISVYVYRPATVQSNGPVMLYTHGGGMVTGSAEGYHKVVSGLASDLGIVVVSTEYRLAPENPFPAALDDVHAAYLWIIAQGASIGIDPARVIVGGDSAGGGLTASLCQRLLDRGEPMPIFQLLIYPMLDDRTTLRPPPAGRGQLIWTAKSNAYGWSSYLGKAPTWDEAPEHAAPARRSDLAGLPPAWIGVGTLDLFYDEDVDYARRLQAGGVRCTLDVVEGAYHGFDVVSKSAVSCDFRQRFLQAVRDEIARS